LERIGVFLARRVEGLGKYRPDGATKVTFGGVKATNFTVNSGSQITATVPQGAVTGKIKVTTPGGTATSKGLFTVT
jgi:hypothetical protein